MQVVVTGASGFIGNAVVRELIHRRINCIPVMRSQRTKFSNHCVVENYAQTPDGDILIHLAENPNVAAAGKKKESIIHGPLQTIEMLLDKKYDRVVYASSCLVYGDKEIFPRRESEAVTGHNDYAELKLQCESLIQGSGKSYGCARLANVYGTGMSSVNIFSDVMVQLNGSDRITIRNGKPVRDYVNVKDVARGLVDMALGESDGIFNLGSGESISVMTLVEKIVRTAGFRTGEREIESLTKADMIESCIRIDISKMSNLFSWHPEISLNDGIQELIRENNEKQ